MTHTVYLGLGSNLNDPHHQLNIALSHLTQHPNIELIQTSAFYTSVPHGPQDQSDFINAVCHIETSLEPLHLLQATQSIEQQQGRIKTRHWGERIIDIDLLLFDDVQLQSEILTIPHPMMLQRPFVLVPLHDIAPHLELFKSININTLQNQLR